MNRSIAIFLALMMVVLTAAGQQTASQTQPQQPKRKIIIQTPFGNREVEVDEPPPATPPVAAQPQAQPPVPGAPQATPPAAAQPAPPQNPPAAQSADNAPVSLRLDNADIYQVIRIIGDALGLNYIIDPSVKGTVNINTAGNLRRSDLLPILEAVLKINGATMIKVGNFYQIVPAATALRQPLQIEERAPAATAPDDQMVMQIIRMKFVAASEMARLLSAYASEGANITAHDQGNILLISERRSNLRKLLEIIDIFDTNVFEGERVRLFPVKNNLARDLVTDLKNIFSGYAMSDNTGAIRFIPIERVNSLLVVTSNIGVFPEVEKWLARLDQPVQNAGRRNFVYRVRNSKAEDIQAVLAQLYGLQVQVSSIYSTPSGGGSPGGPGAPPAPSPGAPAPNPFSAPPQPAGQVPGAVQAGTVRIIADLVNNALVIQATPQEYADIERTIQELDLLPRQVLIDAQIYEVVLDDSLSLGLSAFLQNRAAVERTTTAQFAGTPPVLAGTTFAFVGRTRELVGFLNAQENRSKVKTLSAPSVLVSDNMSAEFTVGADVPVPTSSSVTPVQAGGTNLFAQTIQFRATGVILRVKPKINDSGNVTLEIAQEVSQASPNTTSAVVAPVIGKSSVTSTIVVQDNQTIALGGFIRENNELARSRLPLLGRIPVAGILFGNTRRSNSRTELVILITPHVLRSHDEADLATEELKAKLREVKKLLH